MRSQASVLIVSVRPDIKQRFGNFHLIYFLHPRTEDKVE